MTELRCEAKLHGVVIDEDCVEIACNSRFCLHNPGEVVVHRFNLKTGEFTTRRFAKVEKRN
jgi:hypothetical protein